MDDIRPVPKPTPRLKNKFQRDGRRVDDNPIPADVASLLEARDTWTHPNGTSYTRCQHPKCFRVGATKHHVFSKPMGGSKNPVIHNPDKMVCLCVFHHVPYAQNDPAWNKFWRHCSRHALLGETNRQVRDRLAAEWKGSAAE